MEKGREKKIEKEKKKKKREGRKEKERERPRCNKKTRFLSDYSSRVSPREPFLPLSAAYFDGKARRAR